MDLYEKLESTSKRLEKTYHLSAFLKSTEDLDKVMLLVQGRVFPQWDPRELGIAEKLVAKAICTATGSPSLQVDDVWRETGDLGLTAEKLTTTKTQATLFSQTLSISKVFDNLQKLAELEGSGTVDRKVQLIAELLTSASPKEAKYIIRTVLGALRVGLGSGTLRDSIVWAFFADEASVNYDAEKNDLALSDEERIKYNSIVDSVQGAVDLANDFAEVASVAKNKGLIGINDIPLVVCKPINVMLFQKTESTADGFERVGKPACIEYKYDGFRLQIHKQKDNIKLFTRRLENVTAQFPDVVEYVRDHVKADVCILDAEVIGYKDGRYLPFQNISQRIKRKYDIHEIAKKFPVEVAVFDIMLLDGENILKQPFKFRREKIESVVDCVPFKIRPSQNVLTDDEKVAEEFYQKSLSSGNEGIMMKNMEGIYKPGSRVGFGVKVKPTMETLDVVIIGAEWGEGKRGKWLASFIIGVRSDQGIVEIGRVGTGFKEKREEGLSFDEMTEMLKPLITKEDGREVVVEPKVVIEVDYEEIQASPTYSSGFALRFPRFVRLRPDRSADEVTHLALVTKFYEEQRGRNT